MQGWEGERGMNGESSTDTYTPSCVRQTAGGKLLHNTGSPARRALPSIEADFRYGMRLASSSVKWI